MKANATFTLFAVIVGACSPKGDPEPATSPPELTSDPTEPVGGGAGAGGGSGGDSLPPPGALSPIERDGGADAGATDGGVKDGAIDAKADGGKGLVCCVHPTACYVCPSDAALARCFGDHIAACIAACDRDLACIEACVDAPGGVPDPSGCTVKP